MGCYGGIWGSMGGYGVSMGDMGVVGAMGEYGGDAGCSWGSYGAPVGYLWGSRGLRMGPLWGSYGAAMGQNSPRRGAEVDGGGRMEAVQSAPHRRHLLCGAQTHSDRPGPTSGPTL